MTIKIVKWSEDLSVGHDLIDDDHKKLISLLNKLIAAHYAGVSGSVLADVFAELQAYATEHFAREEGILERLNYPDIAEHRNQHNQFIEDLAHIMESKAGGALIQMLADWLINHIVEHDMKIRDYLQSGLQPTPNMPAPS